MNDETPEELTTPYEGILSLCRDFVQEQGKSSNPSISSYLKRVDTDSQPLLFRNLLGLEIEHRQGSGDLPKVDEYIREYPQFAPIVRDVLLEAASISSSFSEEARRPQFAPSRLEINSRLGSYRLIGELGRGGMGVVYEAVNTLTGNRVALKTLPVLDGTTLHRFKREFRSLSGVNHPNLIGLQQLEADGGQWFFTMDLIEGSHFLDYVRPNGILEEARLRASLAQLVSGVMALHGQNIIHRDLKPSNVMITTQGKVIILDFGLVIELNSENSILKGTQSGAGTPRYMAPEQVSGQKVTAASDWYAVGIMLYEALAGRAPHKGTLGQILHDKQFRDVLPLTGPNIPTDLANLANRLLNRDPVQRPDAREIVKVIAARAQSQLAPVVSGQLLFGRETQLTQLQDFCNQFLKQVSPLTVFIKGRSGEGKTALADRFLSQIRAEKRAVVMAGRCYDRESVPFKALDTLIDALGAYLLTLSNEDVALIIPDDIGILVRMFPVLQRVGMVARAIDHHYSGLDETQLRQRAFRALRSLLGRLARRRPIVWFVDDLQWGDADSAEALFEILRPPETPKLWLLGTYRSDETDKSPFLLKWKELQTFHQVHFGNHEVSVGPLPESEGIELVVSLIGRDTRFIRNRAAEFARETQGNPFLLTELAGCFDPEKDSFDAIPLHEVLARKLNRLPDEAEGLLEAVAVSGQALPLYEASRAAGHESIPMATISRMRNERLIRLIGSDENPLVDTYHDRVRETIIARMDPESNRHWHQKLGEQIEKELGITAEAIFAEMQKEDFGKERPVVQRAYDLAYHFDAAGENRKALVYGLAGAEQARRQSAFEVAANNYEIADRNQDLDDLETRFRIAEGKGQTLARVGRYHEANQVLNAIVSSLKEPMKLARIEMIQCENAIKQGKIQESVDYSTVALRRLGFWIPQTTFGFALAYSLECFKQAWHTLFPGFLHRNVPSLKSDLTGRLFSQLAQTLTFVNTLKTFWANLASLNHGEKYPPNRSLSWAYSFHGAISSVLGLVSRGLLFGNKSTDLASRFDDKWLLGVTRGYQGISLYVSAQYESGVLTLSESISAIEKAADPWNKNMAQFHKGCCYFGLGDLRSALDIARSTFESSAKVGDSRVFCSAYLWARVKRGNIPFKMIQTCFPNRPDDIMSTAHGIMAEGHWHSFHGRSAESLATFEKAYQFIKSNFCWNAHMIVVLPELAGALRRHSDFLFQQDPNQAWKLRKRAYGIAKWSTRFMRFFPASRPLALREWALILDVYGKTQKAWKAATLSCSLALAQKAKYEYAQSLLICGQLAKKLGQSQAEDQMLKAREELERLEKPLVESAMVGVT